MSESGKPVDAVGAGSWESGQLVRYVRALEKLVQESGPDFLIEDRLPLPMEFPVLMGNFVKESEGSFWKRMKRECREKVAMKFGWCARFHAEKNLGLSGDTLLHFIRRQLHLAFPPMPRGGGGQISDSPLAGVAEAQGVVDGEEEGQEVPEVPVKEKRSDWRAANLPQNRKVTAEQVQATIELVAGLDDDGESTDLDGLLEWVFRVIDNEGVVTTKEARDKDKSGRLGYLRWARENRDDFYQKFHSRRPKAGEEESRGAKRDERKLDRLIDDALRDAGGNVAGGEWNEAASVLSQHDHLAVAEKLRAIARTMRA